MERGSPKDTGDLSLFLDTKERGSVERRTWQCRRRGLNDGVRSLRKWEGMCPKREELTSDRRRTPPL